MKQSHDAISQKELLISNNECSHCEKESTKDGITISNHRFCEECGERMKRHSKQKEKELRQRNYENALLHWEKIVEIGDLAEDWFYKGLFEIMQNKLERALDSLRHCTEKQEEMGGPVGLPSLYWRGELLLEMGKDEEALKCYQRMISSDKKGRESWFGLGNWHLKQGNYDKAMSCYNIATKPFSERIYGWYPLTTALALCNKGICYHRKGDYERAVELYTESIANFTRSYPFEEAWFNMGNAYMDMDRPVLAIKCYKQAEAADDDEKKHEAMHNRALARLAQAQKSDDLDTAELMEEISKARGELTRAAQLKSERQAEENIELVAER